MATKTLDVAVRDDETEQQVMDSLATEFGVTVTKAVEQSCPGGVTLVFAGTDEQLANVERWHNAPDGEVRIGDNVLAELAANEYVDEGMKALFDQVLRAAPVEAIYGHKDQPERNGWLYTFVNDMKDDLGAELWEMVCAELRRRGV